MKKTFISISTMAITLISAQNNNEFLKREFERQRIENDKKFNAYIDKHYGANKSPEVLKKIEEQRSKLAGFLPGGTPYFYKTEDIRQVYNANVDDLNQAGVISGLTNAYNGEGIKFTIFDGGRVYEGHPAFNNATGRITNKEAASNVYSDHSTGVAGFIGAKSISVNAIIGGVPVSGDIRGVASNSTIDSYMFNETTLPGNTTPSNIFQKILTAQPNISNHSYGMNLGWDTDTVNNTNAWIWWGNFTSPNTYQDMQGVYWTNDQQYDQIVYNNPSYIIVKSAGNYFGLGPNYPGTATFPKYHLSNGVNPNSIFSGAVNLEQFTSTDTLPATNCSLGYDCIGAGSLAKNIIVVGATNIISSNNYKYTSPSDVVHSDYSSAGPRDDGAIKPDISTTGTNVFYPSSNIFGSISYANSSGTSFSAPIVTGIIGLWTQIHKDLFSNQLLNAASAKTLMVHSALEAGNVGPDPWFGWGYINAKKGAELLVGKSNNTVIFKDETLNNGVINTKTVKASGSEPIKVTISWIDPEYVVPTDASWQDIHNNRNSRLVNDLDLRVIDTATNTVYYPWKLDANNPMTPATKGDNTVDNVEQVVVDNPVAGGTYRIEISNKGALKNNTPQNYSIIVTGYSEVLGTNEAGSLSGIAVAPTITKDLVNVLKAPKKSTFNVYDLSGKKLQSGVINSDKESVDLSSYTKGIYIIEIKTDKDVISKKVIKE
ncbi:S8 family peptidase [Chryseobacterium gossypii]|uniref:S8 family peptidase n=1 Tax=Chryseobacterium gossypii TaxID=3231602 RepID=UPI003524412C